jgi:hypothetical protein
MSNSKRIWRENLRVWAVSSNLREEELLTRK